MTYDLIVIGSGQGGGPLARAFARAGRKVALIERSHVGGTCVNVGCTPTKTMVASARIAYLAHRAHEYGVSVGNIAVDLTQVRARKQRIVERFRNGSTANLERAGVDIIHGSARFVAAHPCRTSMVSTRRRSWILRRSWSLAISRNTSWC